MRSAHAGGTCYFRRIVFRSMSLLILSLSGACTMGHIGSVAGRFTSCENALLMDVYAFGLDLRPQLQTLGATLLSFVYILDTKSIYPKGKSGSWIYFKLPDVSSDAIGRSITCVGLDVEANPEMVGAQIGFVSTFVTKVPLKKSAITYLRFNSRAPCDAAAHIYEYENTKSKIYP